MSERTTTIDDLISDIEDEIKDEFLELLDDRHYQDRLHEMVDNAIPIYYSDLARMLADDTSLASVDDEGLVEGVNDVFKIIQIAIYERLSQAAHAKFDELKDEFEDFKSDNEGEYEVRREGKLAYFVYKDTGEVDAEDEAIFEKVTDKEFDSEDEAWLWLKDHLE